ncbi:protein CMS1, partial [Phenoliferia sp. Uapishka_3]
MAPTASTRPNAVSGDSLEEDFLLEDDFEPSEAGSDAGADGVTLDDSDLPTTIDVLLSDDEEAPPDGIALSEGPAKKKRKLEGKEKDEKRESKRQAKKAKVAKAESEKGEVTSLGLLPSESLADRLMEKQAKALPGLSAIEKDDLRLTESMFLDTSHVTERGSLLDFIKQAIPTLPSTLAKPPKKAGSPRVIVVAGAALRVADLCREVKVFKIKDVDIGKLFAKHIKLVEHVEYLNKTKVGIAVGTPGRIGKLFTDTEALTLTHLSHLILDCSHLDGKKLSLLDMADCREDLYRHILGNKDILERLRMGRMKLVVF